VRLDRKDTVRGPDGSEEAFVGGVANGPFVGAAGAAVVGTAGGPAGPVLGGAVLAVWSASEAGGS
jgi:hypothetical protein